MARQGLLGGPWGYVTYLCMDTCTIQYARATWICCAVHTWGFSFSSPFLLSKQRGGSLAGCVKLSSHVHQGMNRLWLACRMVAGFSVLLLLTQAGELTQIDHQRQFSMNSVMASDYLYKIMVWSAVIGLTWYKHGVNKRTDRQNCKGESQPLFSL